MSEGTWTEAIGGRNGADDFFHFRRTDLLHLEDR